MKREVLKHSIAIYCPTKDNDGNDMTELVNDTIKSMIEIYNGCTAQAASGYWTMDNAVYADSIIACKSFTLSEILEDTFAHIVERILKVANQFAVSVELDNELIIYSN